MQPEASTEMVLALVADPSKEKENEKEKQRENDERYARRLKSLVLDSVASIHSHRAYAKVCLPTTPSGPGKGSSSPM